MKQIRFSDYVDIYLNQDFDRSSVILEQNAPKPYATPILLTKIWFSFRIIPLRYVKGMLSA